MGSSGFPTLFVVGRGNRERPSALAWAAIGRNWMSYEYADRTSVQCCMRAAAKGGIPCLGPKSVVKVCQEGETLAIPKTRESVSLSICA